MTLTNTFKGPNNNTGVVEYDNPDGYIVGDPIYAKPMNSDMNAIKDSVEKLFGITQGTSSTTEYNNVKVPWAHVDKTGIVYNDLGDNVKNAIKSDVASASMTLTNKTIVANANNNQISGITDVNIATGANIAWSKINKNGIIYDDLGDSVKTAIKNDVAESELTLTNKVIVVGDNTISGITDTNIAVGAGIAWSKISHDGVITVDDLDINALESDKIPSSCVDLSSMTDVDLTTGILNIDGTNTYGDTPFNASDRNKILASSNDGTIVPSAYTQDILANIPTETVEANTNGYKFPLWNDKGHITGVMNDGIAYKKNLQVNGNTVGNIFAAQSSNINIQLIAPTTYGYTGDILQSKGANQAPVWVNPTSLIGVKCTGSKTVQVFGSNNATSNVTIPIGITKTEHGTANLSIYAPTTMPPTTNHNAVYISGARSGVLLPTTAWLKLGKVRYTTSIKVTVPARGENIGVEYILAEVPDKVGFDLSTDAPPISVSWSTTFPLTDDINNIIFNGLGHTGNGGCIGIAYNVGDTAVTFRISVIFEQLKLIFA